MWRLIQISALVVLFLAGRRVLLGWLRQPDDLPRLLREAVDAVLGYFIYITVGMLGLSALSSYGYGRDNELQAVLITIAGGLYMGGGVFYLWRRLRRDTLHRR